jgi:hypothetical protein
VTVTDSPRAADMAALVDAIDPATEIRYRQQLAREAALAQRERSWSEGYAAAIADVKAAQHALVNHLRGGVTEAQRWTVRGEARTRATFGQPHKDDYPGQDGAA